jgi:hypothetical protein
VGDVNENRGRVKAAGKYRLIEALQHRQHERLAGSSGPVFMLQFPAAQCHLLPSLKDCTHNFCTYPPIQTEQNSTNLFSTFHKP